MGTAVPDAVATTVPTDAAVARIAPIDAEFGGTLRVAVGAETIGFDPGVDVLSNAGSTIARTVFEPLAAYDREGVARPYLAEAIIPNSAGTVWTIRLRPGIRFHDGTALDATALAAHFEAARTSPLNSALLEPLESVDVVDDHTVVLTMSSAWGAFIAHLTADAPTQLGYVVAPAMLTDGGTPRHPIGTGPFVFDTATAGHSLTVRRNDDYWRSPPALEHIEFRVIESATVRVAALDREEVDVITTTDGRVTAAALARRAAGDAVVLLAPPGDPDVLAINTTEPPLDDVDVRRAMSLAIDRERLAAVLRPDGLVESMTGPYARDSIWYHPTTGSEFDPDEAARLIAAYERDHGPVEITATGVDNAAVLRQQELIVSMWRDVGIDAAIVTAPQAAVLAGVFDGAFDVVGWGGFASIDPDHDYVVFHSDGAGNLSGYADPALDAALERVRRSTELADRQAAYAAVQDRLAAGMPYIWLTSNRWAIVGDAAVRGLDEFTLPDGSPARSTTGPRAFLGQVWVDR